MMKNTKKYVKKFKALIGVKNTKLYIERAGKVGRFIP